MAARLNPRHQQFVRDKIQADKIIIALQRHVDGEYEMTPTQIQAAKILLDKSVSNAPTDINATLQGGVTIQVVTGVNTTDKN
jgi:hypothetical protein